MSNPENWYQKSRLEQALTVFESPKRMECIRKNYPSAKLRILEDLYRNGHRPEEITRFSEALFHSSEGTFPEVSDQFLLETFLYKADWLRTEYQKFNPAPLNDGNEIGIALGLVVRTLPGYNRHKQNTPKKEARFLCRYLSRELQEPVSRDQAYYLACNAQYEIRNRDNPHALFCLERLEPAN